MGFILKEKLKILKGAIKDWSVIKFGAGEARKRLLIKGIVALDLKSEEVGIGYVEVAERKLMFFELWNLLKSTDALTFQRSRNKWLRDGDANSRFFHNCINARKRRNNLVSL
jgi:hypothetical protein